MKESRNPKENSQKVEALLFSSGKKMSVTEIARLCELSSESLALQALKGLQKDYDDRGSALMIVDEGLFWKITVREPFLPIVRKIVADTELSKSVMETLAVVAWKSPITQSQVIKIRTNKAYEHIKELESAGFVKKERKGRTYALKLTEKFFSYFDISGKKIKEMMSKINLPPALDDKKIGNLTVYTEEKKEGKGGESPEEEVKIGNLEVYGLPDKEKPRIDMKIPQNDVGTAPQSLIRQQPQTKKIGPEVKESEEPEEKGLTGIEEGESADDKGDENGEPQEDEVPDEGKAEDEDNEDAKEKQAEDESDDEGDDPPKRDISDELAGLLKRTGAADILKKKDSKKKPKEEDGEDEESEEEDSEKEDEEESGDGDEEK